MNDLIQRLKEVHDYLEGKLQGAYKNTVIDAICKIKDIERKLADAEKQNEWISVEEFSKRDYGWCWISFEEPDYSSVETIKAEKNKEEIYISFYYGGDFGHRTNHTSGKYEIDKIKKVMPITPPQEGK